MDGIAREIEFRLGLVKRVTRLPVDVGRLSYRNTHGDYTIDQLIFDKNSTVGVVDWTCACSHPAVWEIARSFAYAEPSCGDGSIDRVKLKRYCDIYEEVMPLNEYDREMLIPLYIYQLAVCDYYAQYFDANTANAEEYLRQASFATKLLRNNADALGV